jgi:hypothetical protein
MVLLKVVFVRSTSGHFCIRIVLLCLLCLLVTMVVIDWSRYDYDAAPAAESDLSHRPSTATVHTPTDDSR